MKISEAYSLSHLVRHPLTRPIILKCLYFADEAQLAQVHTTLQVLVNSNMGGGIPYDTMVDLIKELDEMPIARLEK